MHTMLRLDQIRYLQTASGEGCGVATMARPGCGQLPGAQGRAGSCWGQVPAPGSQSPRQPPRSAPTAPVAGVGGKGWGSGCRALRAGGSPTQGCHSVSVLLEWIQSHSQTQKYVLHTRQQFPADYFL